MRVAVNLFAFLCGLAVGIMALHRAVANIPSRTGGALEHIEAYGEDYDLIVVGSSFTKVNFLPNVFDERMDELGRPMKSFGLGMKGMRGAEIHYYLERILESHVPRLKWLLADVSLDQNLLLDPESGFNRRIIEWNGPGQFMLSQRHLFSLPGELLPKIDVAAGLLRHLLIHSGNIGYGIEALNYGTWIDEPPPIKDRKGLSSGTFVARGQGWKVERYLKGRARHELSVEQLKAHRQVHKRPLAGVTPPILQRGMRDLARAHGKQLAFILSPVLSDVRFVLKVPGDTPLQVLDFNDPEKYPELYDPGMRYDPHHLSYAGAVLFSRALADAVATQLLGKPAKQLP